MKVKLRIEIIQRTWLHFVNNYFLCQNQDENETKNRNNLEKVQEHEIQDQEEHLSPAGARVQHGGVVADFIIRGVAPLAGCRARWDPRWPKRPR